ncbi:hypothetical protein EGW08_004695 [Elysia chlorotica]|uniref:Uncharacterized protein n=1 Tax=Elysia chlorotica TaxID=188477 RepID=A0A3S1ABG4_ELYCH|nr:hypothetical protein EGW08_004695 [Elysia chlorotica]
MVGITLFSITTTFICVYVGDYKTNREKRYKYRSWVERQSYRRTRELQMIRSMSSKRSFHSSLAQGPETDQPSMGSESGTSDNEGIVGLWHTEVTEPVKNWVRGLKETGPVSNWLASTKTTAAMATGRSAHLSDTSVDTEYKPIKVQLSETNTAASSTKRDLKNFQQYLTENPPTNRQA